MNNHIYAHINVIIMLRLDIDKTSQLALHDLTYILNLQ